MLLVLAAIELRIELSIGLSTELTIEPLSNEIWWSLITGYQSAPLDQFCSLLLDQRQPLESFQILTQSNIFANQIGSTNYGPLLLAD